MTNKQDTNAPRKLCSISASIILLTLGVGLLHFYPSLFQTILEKGLEISPGSRTFDAWKENPMPIYLDIFVFNWTNPQDIYNTSVKPKFEEIGPFRFSETTKKVNITWNENRTISYFNEKSWVFDRDTSVSDLNVTLTTLNTVSVSGAYQARNWNFWMKKGYQFSLSQFAPQLQITKTVGEFTFFGYEDVFVTISRSLAIPGLPELDRVGWFYGRNNSAKAEGFNNMDISFDNLGLLRNLNGNNRSDAYEGDCGKIRGSAGAFYKRDTERTNISFYSTDLCREIMLDYENDTSAFGFHGLKFSASKSFLDNGELLEENKCYCGGECIPYGVLNISHCKYDAPSFISLPHFYKADPYYIDKVEGMKPSQDLHDFFIILEPKTGTPISVAARLQFNVLIQPVKYLTSFEKVPKLYFPIMWFQQVVDVPKDKRLPLKILLSLPVVCQVISYIVISIGLLVLVFNLYGYLSRKLVSNAGMAEVVVENVCLYQEQEKCAKNINVKEDLEINKLLPR